MYINESDKERILSASNGKLTDVVRDFVTLKKSGVSFVGKCPGCGNEKGLNVTPSKDIFKCFHCDMGGKGAVSFLLHSQKMAYPDALKYLAEKLGVILTEQEKPVKKQARKPKDYKSFLERQLEESGLTPQDVLARVYEDDDNNTIREVQVFQTGTRDQYGRIVDGDDMIIYYYDLEGRPVKYRKSNTNRFENLFRVRWQNPEHHKDKNGDPIKYQSPAGSGSHIYIPEKVRDMYRHKRQIKRLFIQEGEKKSEKACKHGIISVGIQGIHNLGSNGRLPEELQSIVLKCAVEEVIFVVDADWDKISDKITPGKQVDQRPKTFAWAIINFRDYFKSFYNLGVDIEVYFAHLNVNSNNDKGIDDLLARTLSGREDELKKDIDEAMNQKDGTGEWMNVHRITKLTDHKIFEFFHLDSAEKFANYHREILSKVSEFRIGKHKWCFNEEGKFVSAQPIENDEQFWEEVTWTDKAGNEKKKLQFDYVNCFNFLKNRGFGRVMMASGNYVFVNLEGKVLNTVETYQIRDYLTSFTEEIAHKEVLNMIYRGGPQYLGPEKLSNLKFIEPLFERPDRAKQILYFRNKYWIISSDKIEERSLSDIQHHVWKDKINDFDATLLKPLMDIVRIDKEYLAAQSEETRQKLLNFMAPLRNEDGTFTPQYLLEYNSDAEDCHFLKFFRNTSNFYWTKEKEGKQLDIEEVLENQMHMVAKMSAMGYLLHNYNDKSNAKAVIAMDGKLSEVGSSNGRSGKSIFGKCIRYLIPQVIIPGKNKKLTEDPFLFENVSEKTDNVFINDVRANLDFEFFFPLITEEFTVNPKGANKFTIPEDQTPKLVIATNHAINGEGGSFRDRQWLIAFSDFYNENHKPVDDFGVPFFSEWDNRQWNLFYNFMAQCLQVWLRFGFVEGPSDRLDMRRLRQFMGENFLSWAEDKFNDLENMFDSLEYERQELYNEYTLEYRKDQRFMTPQLFKKKLKAFCEYKGYLFNPHRQDKFGRGGLDDKRGGHEYFTLVNPRIQNNQKNDES